MFLTPSAEGWSVRLTELECRQNIWGTSKHMGNIKTYGEHQMTCIVGDVVAHCYSAPDLGISHNDSDALQDHCVIM